MTNQEINEYLAEHLFGIRLQCKGASNRVECEGCKHSLKRQPTDYCSNAMAVLEKLMEECKGHQTGIEILTQNYKFSKEEKYKKTYGRELKDLTGYTVSIGGYYGMPYEFSAEYTGKGDTIHEAICRCAVEYLKQKEELCFI